MLFMSEYGVFIFECFLTCVSMKCCRSLFFESVLWYQLCAKCFIRSCIGGRLASFRVNSFLIHGRWKMCLMNLVCIRSHEVIVFGLSVNIDIWPYSNIGLVSVLNNLIIVLVDGPYDFELIVLSWIVVARAVLNFVAMWFLNDRSLVNVTPKNVPCGLISMVLLLNVMSGLSDDSLGARGGLNTISKVLASFIDILLSPQNLIIWLSDF